MKARLWWSLWIGVCSGLAALLFAHHAWFGAGFNVGMVVVNVIGLLEVTRAR